MRWLLADPSRAVHECPDRSHNTWTSSYRWEGRILAQVVDVTDKLLRVASLSRQMYRATLIMECDFAVLEDWETTSWQDKNMKGHNGGAVCVSCYSMTSSWLHKHSKTSTQGPLETNSTDTMRLNGKHKTSFSTPSPSCLWTGNLSPKKPSQPVMYLSLGHRLNEWWRQC